MVWPDGSVHTVWAQPDEQLMDSLGRTIHRPRARRRGSRTRRRGQTGSHYSGHPVAGRPRLKAESRARNIPVIVVSVVDDQPQARQLGAAHYLHSPVLRRNVPRSLEQTQRARTQAAVAPAMVIVENPPSYTLLPAEDHEINRQFIQDCLAALGYQVVAAVNDRCFTADANAYLSKPVDLVALSTLIGKLTEENR